MKHYHIGDRVVITNSDGGARSELLIGLTGEVVAFNGVFYTIEFDERDVNEISASYNLSYNEIGLWDCSIDASDRCRLYACDEIRPAIDEFKNIYIPTNEELQNILGI